MNTLLTDTNKAVFHNGDEVVLVLGTYPGTSGIFLHLTSDVKWADIRERDGKVRSHPLAWLAHVPAPE